MIQLNELRVGNWIVLDWDGDRRQQQIAAIHRTMFSVADWDEDFSDFDLYPIPLTPEILLACGFTQNAEDQITFFHRTGINITKFGRLEKWGTCLVNEVKYLHTLQNIMFALTGQELSYSPNKVK